MRSAVPQKLLKIVEDIDTLGTASLTRLTVLKKWFEHPGRLRAFGLWIARRSTGRKGETKGAAGALLDEARMLLGTPPARAGLRRPISRAAAKSLHGRARDFQSEFEPHQWVSVRIIHCWPLLLVEKGLALELGESVWPGDGYKLAADFCQNYDSRHGNSLNGPSREKIMEIVQFIVSLEAGEEDGRGQSHPARRSRPNAGVPLLKSEM